VNEMKKLQFLPLPVFVMALGLVGIILGGLSSEPSVLAAAANQLGKDGAEAMSTGSGSTVLMGREQDIPWGRNPFLTPEEELRGGRPADRGLTIQTIITGRDKSVATLGGRTVAVGDRIGEERVVAIRPDAVVLERNGRKTILHPKERSSAAVEIGVTVK